MPSGSGDDHESAARAAGAEALRTAKGINLGRDVAEMVAFVCSRLEDLFSGRWDRAHIGPLFDAYCRGLLDLGRHSAAACELVAALCRRSETMFGRQPWSELYWGCLYHLAGDDERAAESYTRAGAEPGVLWPVSIGARSVLPPSTTARYLSSPQREIAPLHWLRTVEAEDAEYVLMVACDHTYLRRFLPAYFASVRRYGARALVHVHVVNPVLEDLEWIGSEAGALWPNVEVSSETYAGLEPRAYFATSRLLHLKTVVQRHRRPVLVTDIDAAFTEDLPRFFEGHHDRDVGLHLKRLPYRAHPWQTIRAGEIAVWPTDTGGQFAKDLAWLAAAAFAVGEGSGIWFVDQNVLYALYNHYTAHGQWRMTDLGASRPGDIVHGKSL